MERLFLLLMCGVAVAAAEPAVAQTRAIPLNLPGGALGATLLELSRQSGLEIMFDRGQVSQMRAAPLRGRYVPDAALQRLAQDAGLTVRRVAPGLYVVEVPQAPPLARPDVTVPELLVIGRRSQNADIRRRETDIQPYRVASQAEILGADRDNLDQFVASRVPSNTTAVPPSVDVFGETNSNIDLRGLGSAATLVLVDGRRMPRPPLPSRGFGQTDINPVPLHAVERMEILTGTAGGIHGFGAEGGVVNVVLARGFEGAELYATGGQSTRGDAGQARLEGRFGVAWNDGRTELGLFASASRRERLRNRQRTFVAEDLRESAALAPDVSAVGWYAQSIAVKTFGSTTLTLKPNYGGATLEGFYTFLPAGLSGALAEVVAALARNMSTYDTTIAEGAADSDIGSTPQTEALLANVRHRFESGVEAYADAVMLWDRGRYDFENISGAVTLGAASPFNPFTRSVSLTFPIEGVEGYRASSLESARYAAGVIAPLPSGWRATADAAFGSARYTYAEVFPTPLGNIVTVNPFGDWDTFQRSVAANLTPTGRALTVRSRFRDLSVRLAGPLAHTPSGASTLTLLAERRSETAPAYVDAALRGTAFTQTTIASRRSATDSLYGELRSVLLGESSTSRLRNLEIQVAARYDRQAETFATAVSGPAGAQQRAVYAGAVFTAGAKASPTNWLTVRGSYATGATPPPVGSLVEGRPVAALANDIDPRRPGDRGYSYDRRFGGNASLGMIRVNTASIGALLSPFGANGPRLSLDYSRIRKTDDLVQLQPRDDVLANEARWPNRVVRAELTEADRARGYTAGRVQLIDYRFDNSGRTKYDTIDARMEWRLPLNDGHLRFYGDGAYYIRQRSITPVSRSLNLVDYLDAPLSRRANGGAEWTRGRLSLGANVQYFGSYRIVIAGQPSDAIAVADAIQGASRVPAQAYLDLHASWRQRLEFPDGPREVRVDLGIVNALDTAPPRESGPATAQTNNVGNFTPHYSRYGDPRQRRVVMTLTAAF